MRTAIVDYLQANRVALTPAIIATTLPYVNDRDPIYIKNKKHIYVDVDQVNQITALNALDGSGATQEHTNIRAFLVTDAKQVLPNYETIVQTIKDCGFYVRPRFGRGLRKDRVTCTQALGMKYW